ncbi:MAG: trypsin-like peptidase domain-containing protein [Planctomycetes bacterium]|nr:trypsin-like peptidase domain-containing protein [Planctomycetota bacterium]
MFAFRVKLPVVAAILLHVGSTHANEELYRRVAPSTVLVYTNQGPQPGSNGTGFLVDAKERLVVTARHVIENPTGGLSPFLAVIFAQQEDGETITDVAHYRKNWQALAIRCKVVYESVRHDLAVLQLDRLPAGVSMLKLAERPARPGQIVHLVGNSIESYGGAFGYCHGHVRSAFRWDYLGARVVATQMPINKGDSGGPMVNERGEVVGFAAMATTGGQLPKNSIFHDKQVTAFGICVTEVRDALRDMRRRQLASKDPPAKQRATVFKGEARAGMHRVFLEKDTMYRVAVKADGFVPDVRLEHHIINPLGNAPIGNEWLHLLTPTESKEYRILIGHLPGREVGKGSFPYTLSVDRIQFEPESDLKAPELKLNEHVRKFEAGKLYDITVKGRGFEPDVQITDGAKAVQARYNNGARANAGGAMGIFESIGLSETEFETSFRFVPARTTDYRMLVAVGPFSPAVNGKLRYTVQVAERQALLQASGQLDAKDARLPQGGPFKIHSVKLEAGKSYQIDLVTTAFDSRLILQDQSGRQLAQGLDAEGFNSRLFFQPTATAAYRVLATAYQFDARGAYTLVVAEAMPGSTPFGMGKTLKKK